MTFKLLVFTVIAVVGWQITPNGAVAGDAAGATRSADWGVYVNGERLDPATLQALRGLIPTLPPGRYWLTDRGDFGREGQPAALNLVVLVRARLEIEHRARLQEHAYLRMQAAAAWQARQAWLQQMVANQGASQARSWNSAAAGTRRSPLSAYDRTGTSVYSDRAGVVGVLVPGATWYPGQ
jgi:hypothetical protein